MNRRIAGILLLLISAVGLFFCVGFSAGTKSLSGYGVTQAQWEAICADRTQTDTPLLESLTLNGYHLLSDGSDRWFYSLIEDDPLAYDPPVRYRATASGVQIAVLAPLITPETISENKVLSVLAYDDTRYHIYHLTCTTLPVIHITYDPGITLSSVDRTPVPMSFYLFDNRAGATRRVTTSSGTIHVRGASSAAFPKKGYRLTLTQESLGNNLRENDISLLGMRQDGDWLLYAAYNDQERIRNVFSSNLWMDVCGDNNDFGISNGMEYRYVELFLNGEYWGLYALGFPIDEMQLRLGTDLTGRYTEYLFQKTDWTSSEKSSTDLTGGVLDGYTLKSENTDAAAAWAALRTYYNTLITSDGISAAPELYELADIRNAIDAYLFFNLIQGVDNVSGSNIKNLYFIIKYQNGSPKVLYTPWDLDQTWGNIWKDDAPNQIGPYEWEVWQDCVMQLNPVAYLRQLGDPDINGLIRQRYQALRQSGWSEESLIDLLERYEAEIFASGAYARDVARWPESTRQAPDLGLSVFKEYVLERLQYMDAFIAALES